ncbi:hypothetical protein VTJ49DRAFT_3090 [Mycothermus thermophilus]|uniref:LysM domain-containing protein n=1 Tax=Humicola insolens TaxID=85995 RepID=A0ABR3V8K1_HUMIN
MSALFRNSLILGLAAVELVAAGSEPGMPVLPGTSPQCVFWHDNNGFLTCEQVVEFNWITVEQFRQYNPSIGPGCTNMQAGYSYCVEIDPTLPTDGVTTSSSDSSTVGTTSTTMVDDCDDFYFVEKGTACSTVLSENDITLAQFYEWNPSVGPNCASLWAEVYVCVSTIDHTPTPVDPGNGITTPAPLQRDVVSNCDAFYLVPVGESCDLVASKNGISVADLQRFNPSLTSDCNANLWAEAYACVSIIGHTPTPVDPGNGVETPSPIQDGMTKNCKTFHFVDGQTCYSILENYQISLADFYEWNPAVGVDCRGINSLILGLGALQLATAKEKPGMPVLPGTHPQCVEWYDYNGFATCRIVVKYHYITEEQFRRYNPSIGEGCTNLQEGYSYCVEIEGEPVIYKDLETSTSSTPSPGITTSTTPSTTSSTTLATTTTVAAAATTSSTEENTAVRPGTDAFGGSVFAMIGCLFWVMAA